MRRRASVLLCLLAIACRRPPERQPAASPNASASAIASAESVPLPVTCRNGVAVGTLVRGHLDCFSEPCDDVFEDLGLESKKRRSVATIIEGHALAGELPTETVDRALCPQLAAMSVCIEETRRTKPSLSGTVEAEVAVTETSVKSVVVTDGSLTDAAVRDCVIEGLARAKYAGSRGTVRYSMSILARWFWPVKLTELAFHVRGKLARETVQRIVRANFPRLSLCYQQALEAVPTLKGTVVAGFSIDKFGAVTAACVDAKSSTLPDAGVRSCMLGVYRSLTFPEP